MLAPGTLVDRYELLLPIGDGAMAQVWVARQKGEHGFEKLVAFKCIHPRFADHPGFRGVFIDEVRIAASIAHPNVAQVFDVGASGSMVYLVMEYVDGESLGALMAAVSRRVGATVPTPIALRVLADACAGLHAAHILKDAAGNPRDVIHRDVSQQNILISVRGDVKLVDFGIAIAKDGSGIDPVGGSLQGKLHHMAPEQARREPVGPATDVYAMGATLYCMLAGRAPHQGSNDAGTLRLLLSGVSPPPLPDTVPPRVVAIVERAIAFEPSERYATALAMQTALEAAIADEGYVADVASWVAETMSERAKTRRAQLATYAPSIAPLAVRAPLAPPPWPSFSAELDVGPREGASAPADAESRRVRSGPALVPYPIPNVASAIERRIDPTPPRIRAPARAPIGAPAGDSGDTDGPGMLDVRALVARARMARPVDARARPPHARPPGHASLHDAHPPSGPASAPPSSGTVRPVEDHAAPAQDAPRPISGSRKDARNAGARAAGWTKLSIGAVIFIFLLVTVLLLLPQLVRARVIALAREAGVELTIDRLGVGPSGVTMRDVRARAVRVPSAELHADEIFASGFSGREIRLRGLTLKIDGPLRDVGPAALAFYDENRTRLAGSGGETRTITIVGARLSWLGFLGEGTSVEASEIGADFASGSAGNEQIRGTVGRFELKARHTTFGPWASSYERSGTTSRLRMLFDPPVPDGPSALLVWSADSPPRLTVRIPRSPLARVGLRGADLGLADDPGTELEVKLEGGQSPTGRIEGSGHLDLFAARLRGMKAPVDVKLEGAASGVHGKPLDLERTTMTLGPFVAKVTGAITLTDSGFRIDGAWRTLPISCERLARAEAKSLGPIALAIQDIAGRTGVARVIGTATASGVVAYDTKVPDEATATILTGDTCGLSIFGH